jgi:periplasmic mercuric ion binding protein
MKKVIILLSIFISIQLSAQTKKVIDTKIFVNGMCDMCEDRIENALDVKGIKVADWDLESKMCRIVYRADLISEEKIHQILADAGHDTKKKKAKKEVYENLHHCCHYKREE